MKRSREPKFGWFRDKQKIASTCKIEELKEELLFVAKFLGDEDCLVRIGFGTAGGETIIVENKKASSYRKKTRSTQERTEDEHWLSNEEKIVRR